MMNTVSATLSVWSENLEPHRITEILCFQADNTVLKGADRAPPRPRPTAFGWHVRCREYNIILAGEVLGHLIDRIWPLIGKIPELRSLDKNISINFFLHVSPKSAEVSLFFERRIIKIMASMNADFDIEYFDP
jgi:Domain of unknown function (DUF4279)